MNSFGEFVFSLFPIFLAVQFRLWHILRCGSPRNLLHLAYQGKNYESLYNQVVQDLK